MRIFNKNKLKAYVWIFICVLFSCAAKALRSEINVEIFILVLGSAPSFFCTLGLLFICYLIEEKYRFENYLYVFLGSIMYEISQLASFEKGTFDWLDIIFIFFAFMFFIIMDSSRAFSMQDDILRNYFRKK